MTNGDVTRDSPKVRASVVVRAKNEASNLEATLQSLRSQSVDVEIIIVDSGSTDGSLEIAKRYADTLIEIPPDSFTFGRALNVGAARASCPVVFALSAHTVASDPTWIERSLAHYADAEVAGVCGQDFGPNDEPLAGPRVVTFDDVADDPYWGFTNHAASWRRSVWEETPFDESAYSCEDKKWMWEVMLRSLKVVIDPSLTVDGGHRRRAGMRALWRRVFLEHQAVAEMMDYPIQTLSSTILRWRDSFPWPSKYPRWVRRASPMRTVEIFAAYFGERDGAARRSSQTIKLNGLKKAS